MATSAYEYALNLLTARPYSERNMRRKLMRRDFQLADVESAVERLLSSGLLDDRRFAEQFVRGRLLGPGASRLRLKQQLYSRGISGELAVQAIDGVIEDELVDLDAIIEKAARKKTSSMAGLDDTVVRRRLYGHLARAGYTPVMISAVMKKVLGTE
ncbi:MAG: regulatory protein RecX [Gemmatimonadaceae bacterium]|nr:regulatory protein RecX [Gemmatimonadaceae bacterium]